MARLTPEQVLNLDRRAAIKMASQVGVAKMQRVLRRAQRDLNQRLMQAEQLSADAGETTFTEAQVRVALAQVREVTRMVQGGMRGVVVEQGAQSAELAATNTVKYMKAADRMFRGMGSQPMMLDEAMMVDRAVRGANSSVLHRLLSDPENPSRRGILERYGDGVVQRFEETLQQRFVARTPWEQVKQKLVADSPFLQEVPGHWAERIVRTECLVGSTRVSGAVVRAAYRRWYEGSVVEVVTARGRKLTTTTNHPMLTRRGWVATSSLKQGDDLVCYAGQKDARSAGYEHIAASPATIAEIFDAVAAVGVSERRRTTEPDFHGDGREGYVDVASTDRELVLGKFAPLLEPSKQYVFTPADEGRLSFCPQCGRLLAMDQSVCRSHRSQWDARFFQPVFDQVVAHAERFAESIDTLTSKVAFCNLRGGVSFDVSGTTPYFESAGVCSSRSDVEFDRVVELRVEQFSGHVYNLSTDDGYFTVDGVYTGNTMAAHGASSWETMREADEQLDGTVVKILCATFDGRTGSDSYAVHGQIRRVDEPFESWFGLYMHPPNRPNDREVVVPHRTTWPIPATLEPRSDGEVLTRWRQEKRKGSPPARPRMTTVPREIFGTPQAAAAQ